MPRGGKRATQVARRARLDPEARRAQILDAAYELLETRGVAAMTVEDVADAAGVSRSLVYMYFGDRDGMVAEVYLRVLAQVDSSVPPGIPADRAVTTETVAACLRFAKQHPSAWRLLVTDSVRRHPVVTAARGELVAGLVDGAGAGEGPAALVADAAVGLIEAGVLHWVERGEPSIEKAAELLAGALWAGLGGLPANKPGIKHRLHPSDKP